LKKGSLGANVGWKGREYFCCGGWQKGISSEHQICCKAFVWKKKDDGTDYEHPSGSNSPAAAVVKVEGKNFVEGSLRHKKAIDPKPTGRPPKTAKTTSSLDDMKKDDRTVGGSAVVSRLLDLYDPAGNFSAATSSCSSSGSSAISTSSSSSSTPIAAASGTDLEGANPELTLEDLTGCIEVSDDSQDFS
jgi:hypothetical protein